MPDSNYGKKLIEEMNRYYDARAPWHDGYMSYTSNEDMEKSLCPIIRTFEEIIVGRRVLEIACGTGNWTQVLAKRAESVTAMDISPRVLEIAAGKLAGRENVSLVQGDAYDLGNIDGGFDVAFSADWWSHIPKQTIPLFMDALMAKLHDKSEIIFIDMTMIDYFRREPSIIDEHGNRVSLRTLPDGSEFRVIKNFPDEPELRLAFEPYGERIVYYDFAQLARWMAILGRL